MISWFKNIFKPAKCQIQRETRVQAANRLVVRAQRDLTEEIRKDKMVVRSAFENIVSVENPNDDA